MTSRHRRYGWILALLAATSLVSYEGLLLVRQREELDFARRAADAAANALAALQRDHHSLRQELETAEQQLTHLSRNGAEDPRTGRDAEVKAWLQRVKQLRQHFAEKPDQRIPEMEYLTDADWLRTAKRATLDSDDETRAALAAIRGVAKFKFTERFSAALHKYTHTGNADAPSSPTAILPYFDPPIDPAILARYEINTTAHRLSLPDARWGIREKAAIDEDFDSRPTVTPNGSMSVDAPEAWIPDFQQQRSDAHVAFRAAHKGALPSGLQSLLPYMDPPLDPATVERLLKAERRRGQ